MSYMSVNQQFTVLYYTAERYEEYQIGHTHEHFGRTIRIAAKWMRPDLGDYFEICYSYVV